ncbi:MAG: TraM recognition domain-containing protein [Armatimonadetes bacterium]|nr:TraM recognition domain-containing protein [Armatimonadota bacterium]
MQTMDEATQMITEVRESMAHLGGDATFWRHSGLDALILTSPMHDGSTGEIARQTYHRLVARLIGAQVHKFQTAALHKGLKVAIVSCFAWYALMLFGGSFVAGSSFTSMNGMGGLRGNSDSFDAAKVIGAILPFLFFAPPVYLVLYAKSMMASAPDVLLRIPVAKIREEAKEAVQRCFLKAVPKGAPQDLADIWRHSWYTNEGRPISSEIVETDANSLVASEIVQGWRSCSMALMTCAFLCLMPCLNVLILPALWGMLAKRTTNPGTIRSQELDRRQAVEGAVLVAAGGIEWSKHQEQARMMQIAEAMNDKTPILRLGKSTGILAARGDSYAPSVGVPFDLSLRDLQNHLLVLGGTGSGKTSGILRPLAHQISSLKGVGLVVMDGKASLPGELKSLAGMQIVDPAESKFSLVSGLSPAELVDTIVDVLTTGQESDPYWSNSAAGLLRRAAVLARFIGGSWWTLSGIGKLATSQEELKKIIDRLDLKAVAKDPLVSEAVSYFMNEWSVMDEKPKSGIMSHAMTWIATITAHPELLAWAEAKEGEDSFDLFSPLTGGRLGFLIPAHRYGRAGAVVTALLKARIYSRLKERAEGKSTNSVPVVFLIDEAQEVATKDDATMLSIGRSLGLAMVGATQTIEGITEKLGDKAAAKWLAVYGNALSLTGRSPATDEFMAKRAGSVWKAAVQTAPGISVKDSIVASQFSGSIAASRRQTFMREFALPAASPLAPFMEKSRQAQANQQSASADPRDYREADEGISSSVRPVPLIHAEEISTLLAEQNLALMVAIRARAPRRDVIKLEPKFG